MNNNRNKGLSAISSSLVLWDGDDVPCIKLCKGDMVSDVIYKLGHELCIMRSAYDLKNLDLKTLVEACLSCPQPVKTLQIVLQLVINKIASIDDILTNLQPGSGALDEKVLVLANCFLGYKNSEGDVVTRLPISEYVRLIASSVCAANGSISGLETDMHTLSDSVSNLTRLINGIEPIPLVHTTCIISPNVDMPITQAYSLLEQQFCALRGVLGKPEDSGDKKGLNTAIGKQPDGLNDAKQLSSEGIMSSIVGWRPETETVADSFTNLWLTVNDMRGAVQYIVDNCCKPTCASIIIDFDVSFNDDYSQAIIYFANKSKIPAGFTDCDSKGNLLKIVDEQGHAYTTRIKIAEQWEDYEGYTIDLSGGKGLIFENSLSFEMDACFTNGSLTCQKCIKKPISITGACGYCEITVTGGVVKAGETSTQGELVIVYED